jgi:hypothetical protein
MSEETARLILFVIAGVGAVFWAVTAISFAGIVRGSRGSELALHPGDRFDDIEGPPGDDVLTGQVEVEGKPAELTVRLAESLGRSGLAGMLVRVLERTDDRVVFDVTGQSAQQVAQGQASSRTRRAEVFFKPVGAGRTRIDYAIDAGGGSWMVKIGWVFVVLGLVAVVGGFWALNTYVVPSPNPSVRGQSAQMLQCVHFLWPPWLFGMLYRQTRTMIRIALDTLLTNLPYL